MYKCNNCKKHFEKYKKVAENTGEKWFICPYCKGTDFSEVSKRKADDTFLLIKKKTVIDYVVTAMSSLNKGNINTAKQVLTELIGEMTENLFEYEAVLNSVKDRNDTDKLIEELQVIVEIKLI